MCQNPVDCSYTLFPRRSKNCNERKSPATDVMSPHPPLYNVMVPFSAGKNKGAFLVKRKKTPIPVKENKLACAEPVGERGLVQLLSPQTRNFVTVKLRRGSSLVGQLDVSWLD